MWSQGVFYLASPLSLVFMLAFAGFILRVCGKRRAGITAVCVAFVLLWICSLPIVAHWGIASLERRYIPIAPGDSPTADAIVVLGGAIMTARPPDRPVYTLGPAAQRVWHAAALYRAGKAPSVIVAAGNAGGEGRVQAEAIAIEAMLQQLGVPPGAIRKDAASTTTRENAAFSAPLLRAVGARRILLVTSAYHMPRAIMTFQSTPALSGIEIIPSVSEVITNLDNSWALNLWLPSPDSLFLVTRVLKEFAGMAALAIIRDTL